MYGARFVANMQFYNESLNFSAHSGTGGAISTLAILTKFLSMFLYSGLPEKEFIESRNIPLSGIAHTFPTLTLSLM